MQDSKISVTPQFLLFAAGMVLLVPIPWVFGWLLAVVIHELGHCVALGLCKVPIHHVQIDICGARIATAALSWRQAVFCSLAGPIGGCLLLMGARVFPKAALCAFFQSVYNLIPVNPLDGGRAVHALLSGLFTGAVADRVCTILDYLVCALVVVLAVVAAYVYRLGSMPLILAAGFCLRMKKIKIPCK